MIENCKTLDELNVEILRILEITRIPLVIAVRKAKISLSSHLVDDASYLQYKYSYCNDNMLELSSWQPEQWGAPLSHIKEKLIELFEKYGVIDEYVK
jgi:hypothetical protein